jgi:hypothetical protein
MMFHVKQINATHKSILGTNKVKELIYESRLYAIF